MPGKGPAPFPRAIADVRGRPVRNKHEPKPAIGLPSCPSWLPPAAKAEWKRLGPQLAEMNLISRLDRSVFAGYCLAWATVREAQENLNGSELTQDTTGGRAASAWLRVRDKALDQIRQFGAEFGLSPSSRTRISAEQPKSKAKTAKQITDKHGRPA